MRRRRRGDPWWTTVPDRELLDVRLSDLEVSLKKSWVGDCIEQLYEELAWAGLKFKPHAWLSGEWFSPDGIPGIAVPFYLMHDRLIRLERRKMLEVEGGTERECMKLLRHEAGHAVCTAFRLHYRKRWREVFGTFGQRYPESYVPRARSKKFVLHLDWWYAQAHPAEDFAETFAVWLTPSSRWRRTYAGWPALKKLEYTHTLMESIEGDVPSVRSRKHVEPLSKDRRTLAEYYEEKQSHYGRGATPLYDSDLLRLFSDDPNHEHREGAAVFLRRHRKRIREIVVRWTGESAYAVDQVLSAMIDRCKELKLRRAQSESAARDDATVLVAVQTTKLLHRVPHRILL